MTPAPRQPHEPDRDETVATLARWRTELSLTVRGARAGVGTSAVSHLLRNEVNRLETAASRFRPDSEISEVNRHPGRWVSVSWYFAQVLDAALTAAAETAGLVNPCLAYAVDAAGYPLWRAGSAPSAGHVARSSAPTAAARVIATAGAAPAQLRWAWREIQVRPAGSHAEVRIPPGTALDLGAVAKGWLADRLAEAAVRRFDAEALAAMGGDVRAIARTEPWQITVAPGPEAVQDLWVWDAGVATSGTARRAWINPDGSHGHHIVDPRTGQPATGPWRACAVMAAGAEGANALSTGAIVHGPAAAAWLTERGAAAWLVGAGRSRRVGAWPALTPAALPA